MKTKLFKTLAATAMSVLAIACAKEPVGDNGQQAGVSFMVEVPGASVTKAYGEAEKATELYYQVFDNAGAPIEGLGVQTTDLVGKAAKVSFQLVKDQTYNFVFWAQTTETGYYTIDETEGLKKIKANYTDKLANDENFDAFFATESFKVTGPVTKTVTLKRPFAQINIGTKDQLKAGDATAPAINFNGAKSLVTVKGVPTVFSPLATTPETMLTVSTDVTFASAAIPTGSLNVKGTDYNYLAMNYVFAPAEGTVCDLSAEIVLTGREPIQLSSPTTPIKRNWRTNILGSLLTSSVDFNVVVDPVFETPDQNVNLVSVASLAEANTAFENGATNVTVTMLAEDDPATIVLPKTKETVGITLPSTTKSLTVAYAASATDEEKPQTVGITAQNITDLTIDAPATHVEVNGVTASSITATTSGSTLVIGKDVTVGTLEILGGAVEIYGKVETLKNENNCPVKVWAVGDKETWKKAYDAAAQTIELSADIPDFTEIIFIGRDLILKGNGHEICNTANRVIRIEAKANVAFYDLTLTSKSTASSDTRCVSFDNTSSGSKVLFDNCTLSAGYYCINLTPGANNLNVTVRNATVAAGWAAINSYSNDSEYVVENSILKGLNDKSESSWNNFATIVFDGNGLGNQNNVAKHGTGNSLTIKNSTVYASSESKNNQAWFSAQYGAQDNEVRVDDTRIIDADGNDQTDNIATWLNWAGTENDRHSYESTNKVFINGTLWEKKN